MVVGVDDAGQDIAPGRIEGLPRRAGADLRCHLGDDAVGDRYVGAPDAVAGYCEAAVDYQVITHAAAPSLAASIKVHGSRQRGGSSSPGCPAGYPEMAGSVKPAARASAARSRPSRAGMNGSPLRSACPR